MNLLKKKKKVSVVIPADFSQDNPQQLVEAIRSYVTQDTKMPYEVIVVDDGSPNDALEGVISRINEDSTLSSARDDGILRILRNYEHLGTAGAINTGLKEAEGKYLAIAHSGGVAKREKLEVLAGALDDNRKAGLMYAGQANEDGTLCEIGPDFGRLLKEGAVSSDSVMFRRGALDKVGFLDEHLEQGEQEYLLRVAGKFPIIFSRDVVYQRGEYKDSPQDSGGTKEDYQKGSIEEARAVMRARFGKDLGVLILFPDLVTGIARAAIEQGEGLYRAGVANVTLGKKGGWNGEKSTIYVKQLGDAVLDEQHTGLYSDYYQDLRNWETFSDFNQVLSSMGYKPDFVHSHHVNCVNELKIIQGCAIPILYYVHIIPAHRQDNDGLDRQYMADAQVEAMEVATNIITSSPQDRDIIKRYYPQFEPKIRIIPYGMAI